MRLPNVVGSALLMGLVAILQYLLANYDLLHVPAMYAPVGVFVLTLVLKMIQEWKPEEQTTREAQQTPTFWQRVIYK